VVATAKYSWDWLQVICLTVGSSARFSNLLKSELSTLPFMDFLVTFMSWF